MDNYKKCPLKKRPIVFEDSQESYCEEVNQEPENLSTKPQDLSLKTKKRIIEVASDHSKNFALNLSSTSVYDQLTCMNPTNWHVKHVGYGAHRAGSVSPSSSSTSSTSSLGSYEYNRETSMSPPAASDYTGAIHLRGLKPMQIMQAENMLKQNRYAPYWNKRSQSKQEVQPISLLHKPAAAIWNEPLYEPAPTEPEDLSIKQYIPEPALYHNFGSDGNSSSSGSEKNRSTPRYKCDDCGKSYSTFAGLSKHQQFHCPAAECNQVKKVFNCKSCDKVYTSLGALKMHIRTHTLPCKCNICGKAFSRPWLLQGHIRTHTGEKPFNCQYCHRAFADRSNLRAHLQTHADVKKYLCPICNKSFSRMSLLNKHNEGGCCTPPGPIQLNSIPIHPVH